MSMVVTVPEQPGTKKYLDELWRLYSGFRQHLPLYDILYLYFGKTRLL